MPQLIHYVWLDGNSPAQLRSKARILPFFDPSNLPSWTFDGSSTNQAKGIKSDITLKPQRIYPSQEDGIFLLCECFNGESPHESNNRALLRSLNNKINRSGLWLGFEQEWTMCHSFSNSGATPYAVEMTLKDNKYTISRKQEQQGRFYCGVGSKHILGRKVVEEHVATCLRVGINIVGINAEVMPGQWEFQIGPSMREGDDQLLKACDDLIMARYLLQLLTEDQVWTASLDPKPLAEMNGAGLHTNISTTDMRKGDEAWDTAHEHFISNLSTHADAIWNSTIYGPDLKSRLTGVAETAKFGKFTSGIADRAASIRIPQHCADNRAGYIEDRRPNADADPYRIARYLVNLAPIETTVGI